jgi:hypothetical protein
MRGSLFLLFLRVRAPLSIQSHTLRQCQLFCLEVRVRRPLAEVLRMHATVKPDAEAVLANQGAVKLAVAGVGKRSKDGAGALIDRLTNVHGEGEDKDETEEIDAKQRMQ